MKFEFINKLLSKRDKTNDEDNKTPENRKFTRFLPKTLNYKSLKFKILMYFITFSVFILALLWVLQVIFFNSYYVTMKKNELQKIGNSLVASYGSDSFNSDLREYSFQTNIRVYLLEESESNYVLDNDNAKLLDIPREISGGANGHRENFDHRNAPTVLERIQGLSPNEFSQLKSQLKSLDGSSYDYIEISHDKRFISFASNLTDSAGKPAYIYITCPLPSVDSSIEVLKTQLVMITIILFLLSIIVATMISKKLSIPLIKLTSSAKELALGNLNVNFYNEGYTEVIELSKALTYATSELSKLDEYRKDFMANVSHDLKTPLTIIKFYGEMIRDVSGDTKKRTAHCDLIIKEADRLTDLVNEVLELSKLESNNASINITRFNISKCAVGIIKALNILTERDGYEFITDIDSDIFILGDEASMKRIIYNLISNAINYTGQDKKVYISLKSINDKIRFEVKDTGEGIPEGELENIWERYYKLNGNHKRAIVGTGLGLSIVKNMLSLHKASYGAISEIGAGSTFWFEL